MGKHRSLDQRLDHAERMVERNDKSAKRHAKRRQRLCDKGEVEKAQEALVAYERASRLFVKWRKEWKKIAKQIQIRDALNRRAPASTESGRGEVPLTPAQQRQREREQRAEVARRAQKKGRMKSANMDWDPRTAAGRRTYDLVNLGSSLRAHVSHFNAVIRKVSDRTDTRLLAWSAFDSHYHNVSAGLMPPPRFEPGVDTSSVPGMDINRMAALQQDSFLREELGRDMHSLLVEVVHHQRNLSDLPGLEGLLPRERVVLLLRALDLAALFWKLDQVRPARTRHTPVALDSSPAD